MMRVNPLRAVLAVLGGVVLLNFMSGTLEQVLVGAIAGVTPADAAYVAARDRAGLLAAALVMHALAAVLAGYILAKIAGAYEVHHALVAAVVLTTTYAFTMASGHPLLPPTWASVVRLVVTPLALFAGASIRAEARSIRSGQAETGDVNQERR